MVSAAFMNIAIGAGKRITEDYEEKRDTQLKLDADLAKQAEQAKTLKEATQQKYEYEKELAKQNFEDSMILSGQKIAGQMDMLDTRLGAQFDLQSMKQDGDMSRLLVDKNTIDATIKYSTDETNKTNELMKRIGADTSLAINQNNIKAQSSQIQQEASNKLYQMFTQAGIDRDQAQQTQLYTKENNAAKFENMRILQDSKIEAGATLQESKINFETWKTNKQAATQVLIQGTAAERNDWTLARDSLANAFKADENAKSRNGQERLLDMRNTFLKTLSDSEHINDMEKLDAIQTFDERMKGVDFNNDVEVLKVKSALLKDVDNNRIGAKLQAEKELLGIEGNLKGLTFDEAKASSYFSTGEGAIDPPLRNYDLYPKEQWDKLTPSEKGRVVYTYKSKLRVPRNGNASAYIAQGQAAGVALFTDILKTKEGKELKDKQDKAAGLAADKAMTEIDKEIIASFGLSAPNKDETDSPEVINATPSQLEGLRSQGGGGRLSSTTTANILSAATKVYITNPETKQLMVYKKIDPNAFKANMTSLVKGVNFLRYAAYRKEEGLGEGYTIKPEEINKTLADIVAADQALDSMFGRKSTTIEAITGMKRTNPELYNDIKQALTPYSSKPNEEATTPPAIEVKDLPPPEPVVLEGGTSSNDTPPTKVYGTINGRETLITNQTILDQLKAGGYPSEAMNGKLTNVRYVR